VIVTYQLGNWSECSCQTSTQRREVVCVDLDGTEYPDERCELVGATRPQTRRDCQPINCTASSQSRKILQELDDVCDTLPCSQKGTCTGSGECECNEGYAGVDCQIDLREDANCPPPSLYGPDGECCKSGVLDFNQNCCPGKNDQVQLDANGQCCDGKLDMYGLCNGSVAVDALGRCCQVGFCLVSTGALIVRV